jgi:hypothetical protein
VEEPRQICLIIVHRLNMGPNPRGDSLFAPKCVIARAS